MDEIKLAKECARAIMTANAAKVKPTITLMVEGNGKGKTRKVLGRTGPRGVIVGTDEVRGTKYDICIFDPLDILAWMQVNNLITVTDKDGNEIKPS